MDQAVWIDGDDAIYTQVNECFHDVGLVDGPIVNFEVVLLSGRQKGWMGGVERAEFFGYLKGVCVGAISIAEMEATEGVVEQAFGKPCGGGNFGELFAEGSECAAVKTGDQHLVCHVVLANEVAKCGGDVGFCLFDFDGHSGVGQSSKDLRDGWNRDVFSSIRVCLPFIICPSITCIKRFEFFKCEVAYQTFAIGGAVYCIVVDDDQDTVFGAVYIHFENVCTEFNSLFESIKRITRP